MYVRTVLYVQYLIFLKTRKISEDLPICYRIRAVHGSRPFRAGPKPYRRASGTWQNPYSQRFCSKVLAKILQSAWLWRLPGASLAGRPLSARVFAFKGDWPEFAKIWNSDRNSQNFGFWPVLRTQFTIDTMLKVPSFLLKADKNRIGNGLEVNRRYRWEEWTILRIGHENNLQS